MILPSITHINYQYIFDPDNIFSYIIGYDWSEIYCNGYLSNDFELCHKNDLRYFESSDSATYYSALPYSRTFNLRFLGFQMRVKTKRGLIRRVDFMLYLL